MNKLTNIHKIAVLRATNLGDFIAALPALDALRDAYPDAEIVYLGKPFHKALLESRPSPVDRVIVVPVSHGVREEPSMPHLVEDQAELDAFFRRMQAEHFDLGIQMHGGGKNSNPFVKRLGAPFNIGTKTPDAIAPDRWIPYLLQQNEFFRWVELVRLVGATTHDLEPRFPVTAEDIAEVERVFPMLTTPFVVLHPGASDVRRRWQPERFAQVGDALASVGFQVVITGIESERDVVERVLHWMAYPAVNACGKLSITALTGLLASAALVVSNDTGTMHLANAVGTPNVAIFWCFNAPIWTHLGRTIHRPLISWMLTCPICGGDLTHLEASDEACQHETCYVNEVSADQVVTAAFDLLAYVEQFGETAPTTNGKLGAPG